MKSMLLIFSLVVTFAAHGSSLCEQLQRHDQSNSKLKVLKNVDILNQDNWYNIDVVLGLQYKRCKNSIKQELISFKGQKLYRFRSVEDSCDGGNTYGSIYSLDLKTPIAHIYDYDTYCQSSWRPEYMAKNNRCNAKAIRWSEKKMAQFGKSFKASHARVELRDPYQYDYIDVEGHLNEDGRYVVIRVLADTQSCKFASTRIISLEI